jgi:hypothetical protein
VAAPRDPAEVLGTFPSQPSFPSIILMAKRAETFPTEKINKVAIRRNSLGMNVLCMLMNFLQKKKTISRCFKETGSRLDSSVSREE